VPCRRSARGIQSYPIVGILVSVAVVSGCTRERAVRIGFWLEPVHYTSSRFPGGLTTDECEAIASVAHSEVARAFAGLRIDVSARTDARYRVRVVQHVRDPRFRSDVAVAGQSRAVSIAGGDGVVNFSMLAAFAESYAPTDADRAAVVIAIGSGVGRAAVHEFVHQLLRTARIDEAVDRATYEYGSAARAEQYYGEMRWGEAWPRLHQRFGGR
jgi:hypothetical protein